MKLYINEEGVLTTLPIVTENGRVIEESTEGMENAVSRITIQDSITRIYGKMLKQIESMR